MSFHPPGENLMLAKDARNCHGPAETHICPSISCVTIEGFCLPPSLPLPARGFGSAKCSHRDAQSRRKNGGCLAARVGAFSTSTICEMTHVARRPLSSAARRGRGAFVSTNSSPTPGPASAPGHAPIAFPLAGDSGPTLSPSFTRQPASSRKRQTEKEAPTRHAWLVRGGSPPPVLVEPCLARHLPPASEDHSVWRRLPEAHGSRPTIAPQPATIISSSRLVTGSELDPFPPKGFGPGLGL